MIEELFDPLLSWIGQTGEAGFAFTNYVLAGTLLIVAAYVFMYMSAFFVLALILKRNDVVDVAWGLGFVGMVWLLFGDARQWQTAHVLLLVIITLWGLRLAGHIYLRNKEKEEDFRYKKWREEWGKWAIPRAFLQVFMLQGLFMITISSPIWFHAGLNGTGIQLQWWHILGLAVWLLGFLFEAVGDYQLKCFLSDPANKGKIMDKGLWKYTRHPNYFGEMTMWWAIFFIAFIPGNGWYYIAAIGPALMMYTFLRISGPMLEKSFEGKPGWKEYVSKTSMYVPLPPKQ